MIQNPTDVADLEEDVAALEHYHHSRYRVYPQNVGLVAELVAAATTNVFGDWIQIIPIDTVDFAYEVIGFVIEEADAAGTYLIQLGFSIEDTDPVTTQIAGERRTLLPAPAVRATELLEIKSQNIPADAKLWGRVKSKAGGSETIGVSVVVARHIEVTNPVTKLATWPWSE